MWYAVILGGGSGTRMGMNQNKVMIHIGGESMLTRSIRAFFPHVDGIVVVMRSSDLAEAKLLVGQLHADCPITLVPGGATRQESVLAGLNAIPVNCEYVMIHDGARCLVDPETISNVKQSVIVSGTGVASIPVTDTIKITDVEKRVVSTPDRSSLRAVQTPQGFSVSLLKQAHAQALKDGFVGTDDSSLVERLGIPVQLTEGSIHNMKITHSRDIETAESILNISRSPSALQMRIGSGYDAHRLVENRELVLCGVHIPYSLGLLGHSDADVAIHALIDALLGAAGKGDIGKLFPDNDPQYKDISSMILLKKAMDTLSDFLIINADITIVAQQPKLSPYIDAMRKNIADILSVNNDQISVKATTTEKMGFEGRGEGISAQAVVLLQRK